MADEDTEHQGFSEFVAIANQRVQAALFPSFGFNYQMNDELQGFYQNPAPMGHRDSTFVLQKNCKLLSPTLVGTWSGWLIARLISS
jgi:hypothetical protein